MSRRLTRVVFTTPVQDPSTPPFERRDFHKLSSKALVEQEDDYSIRLSSGDRVVLVVGIPYWCIPEVEPPPPITESLPEPKREVPPPEKVERGLPPVTQSQAHPRERVSKFRLKGENG